MYLITSHGNYCSNNIALQCVDTKGSHTGPVMPCGLVIPWCHLLHMHVGCTKGECCPLNFTDSFILISVIEPKVVKLALLINKKDLTGEMSVKICDDCFTQINLGKPWLQNFED